ncbi:MAG: hypothetical protein EOO20_15605, partial [Chryseobacterium sp.]
MEITAYSKPFELSNKTKDLVVFIICLICIFLFLTSAYDKISEHSKFVRGLSKVAYIGGYAELIGWLVPATEVAMSILLINPKTHKLGLIGFIATMAVFTAYILSMILWAEKLPCHCNLIIEKLTWGQHIWFNLIFIVIAA